MAINTAAEGLRPVQLALASLISSDPATLLGLLVSMQSHPNGERARSLMGLSIT